MDVINDIKIVTYNVLAQRFADNHYDKYFHNSISKEDIVWDKRLLLIKEKIVTETPDVILLQEVELETFDNDYNSFKENYGYIRHAISKKRDNPIGNVILYKKDKFEYISESFNSCSIIIKLKLLLSNKFIIICNIHLRAGLKSKRVERHSQIKSCQKLIDKLNTKDNTSIIISGDFNDDLIEDDNPVLKELLSKNYTITRSGTSCCVYNTENQIHNYFEFDHIITLKCSIKFNKLNEWSPFPNKIEPSDHIMMIYNITTD